MPMNDIERPPRSTTHDAAPASSLGLTLRSLPPRSAADPRGTTADHGIRLTWRKLDRLAAAATLGVILASPRTALLIDQIVGSRIPASIPVRSSYIASSHRKEGPR